LATAKPKPGQPELAGRRRNRSRGYDSAAVSPAPISKSRFAAFAAITALLALLVAPSGASAITAVPRSGGSPNADSIAELYKIILAISVIIFLGVEGFLIRALLKYRASKGAVADETADGRRSEIGWAIGATVLVAVLAALTFIKLPSIADTPAGKTITVNVTGRQYIWRFTYGNTLTSPFSYTQMVVPSDTVVVLKIQSTDVIHSWWIPALGGKTDAIPGNTTSTWFKAPTPKSPDGDVYNGQSAALSGRQFANMLASVRVLTPAAYAVWLAKQTADLKAANEQGKTTREKLTQEGQIPNLSPAP